MRSRWRIPWLRNAVRVASVDRGMTPAAVTPRGRANPERTFPAGTRTATCTRPWTTGPGTRQRAIRTIRIPNPARSSMIPRAPLVTDPRARKGPTPTPPTIRIWRIIGGTPGGQARQFLEELKKFQQEHGEEARELNENLRGTQPPTSQPTPEDQPQESHPSGEPGATGGGGGENAPESDAPKTDTPEQPEDSAAPAEPANPPDDPNTAEPSSTKPQTVPPDKPQPPASQPAEPPNKEPAAAETDKPSEPETSDDASAAADKPASQPATPPDDQSASDDPTQSNDDDTQSGAGEKPQQDEPAAHQPSPESTDPGDSSSSAENPDSPPPSPAGNQPAGDKPVAENADNETTIDLPGVEPPQTNDAQTGDPADSSNDAAAEPPATDAGTAAESVDTLELLKRADKLELDDLSQIRWSSARKLEFVDAYNRLRELADRTGVLDDVRFWRANAVPGESGVSAGTGQSGDLSLELTGQGAYSDGLSRIAPPGEQHVAPELQAVLDAYYRTLAERRAAESEPREPAQP